MEAEKLKQVDLDFRNHQQAYLNYVVKAEKKAGKNKSKPVYTTFKKFYDYEKAVEQAKNQEKPKGRFSGLSKFLKERSQ